MENIFKQQGVVNLLVPESTDSTILLTQIKGALLSHGATEIEAHNNTLIFKGGSTPFKTNINPLMPVSSGTLEVFGKNGKYHAKYTLKLLHLLFWCIVSVIGIFIVLNANKPFDAKNIFTAIATSVLGCLFLYFGYYGTLSTRFSNLLKRAVASEA